MSGGMEMADRNRLEDVMRLEAQLRDVEYNIKRLLGNAGLSWEPAPPPGSDVPPGVMEALEAGDLMAAYKAYRGATGVGLKEAQEAVEAIRAGR